MNTLHSRFCIVKGVKMYTNLSNCSNWVANLYRTTSNRYKYYNVFSRDYKCRDHIIVDVHLI